VIDGAECAGISGFRADWDRAHPARRRRLLRNVREMNSWGTGPSRRCERSRPCPAPLPATRCTARYWLRLSGAAERIAEALGKGKVILRAELVLDYKGAEKFFPAGRYDRSGR